MNIPTEIPLLPDTKNLIVLEGVITDVQSMLIKIDFMNKPLSKRAAARVERIEEVGRVLGGAAGSSVAVSTPYTPSTHSARVEFMLDDKQIRGWLGRFYFNSGDFVKVVVAKRADHYECLAVLRPLDKIIATYPWSTKGFAINDKGFRRFISYFSLFVALTSSLPFLFGANNPYMLFNTVWVGGVFWGGVFILLRPERRYCAVAEELFKALGWKDPGSINLEKNPAWVKVPEPPGSKWLTLNYFYKDEWSLA